MRQWAPNRSFVLELPDIDRPIVTVRANYPGGSPETIDAEIRHGSQRDAIMFACSANATHGLRRTQADKRNAIETMLRDPEWSRMSDREIGKACATTRLLERSAGS